MRAFHDHYNAMPNYNYKPLSETEALVGHCLAVEGAAVAPVAVDLAPAKKNGAAVDTADPELRAGRNFWSEVNWRIAQRIANSKLIRSIRPATVPTARPFSVSLSLLWNLSTKRGVLHSMRS